VALTKFNLFQELSNIDEQLWNPKIVVNFITVRDRHLPVTESVALPPN
jgi:hypothetical protein